jgi:uncharacterized membrane protein
MKGEGIQSLEYLRGVPNNMDQQPSPKKRNAMGMGIAVGIAIGAAIGVAMDNLAIGIAIGIAIGAAFGAMWSNREES